MKLKQWLREQKEMTYAEFKLLPEDEQEILRIEHYQFNQSNQKKKERNRKGWRPMTEEEIKYATEILEHEKKRYEASLKIGGIDERGNYTALHHRWE